MGSLLQISDPHFGTERPAVVEALLRLVDAQDPEVVVMSGDITQRATDAQFERARAFVARLAPRPVLAIPGNHDIALFNLLARSFWPYRRFQRVFGQDLEPVYDSPQWRIVCLNTTRRWRHVDGEVSPAQVLRSVRALQAAQPGQTAVVVVHQPAAVRRAEDRKNLLHGRTPALQAWANAGARVVLGGHIHLPYALHVMPDGAAGRGLWVVQAGTAVSSRVRHEAGNSVNLLRPAEQGPPCLERWDYAGPGAGFACQQRMPLDSGPQ